LAENDIIIMDVTWTKCRRWKNMRITKLHLDLTQPRVKRRGDGS
jgi:hypothetical protein